MDAASWAQLKEWFGEAIDADAARRAEIVADAERASPALAAELRALLKEHDAPAKTTGAMTPSAPAAIEAHSSAGPASGSIGPYKIIRELGRGGTGIVFLAERADDEFHRAVALKVMRYAAWDAQSQALLTQERRTLAQLQHPNIAQLLDWGDDAGAPWLAMEYVEGEPVDEYCRASNLNLSATLAVFEQICDAVQYAHRHLVVHRDLKPANILVSASGRVHLLDFGISKLLSDEAPTRTMERRFTPAFASPEQILGEPVTAAADIYALGLILYSLVAETVPFSSGSMNDVAQRVRDVEWPAPSSVTLRAGIDRRELAGDFDRIVLHALARKPEQRYLSVEQMLGDIIKFRGGFPISAQAPTFAYRSMKFVRRNALSAALAAVAGLALIGGAGASIWNARIARQEERVATSRFNAVRQLARSVIFDMYDEIRGIPGSVKARQLLVTTAVKYLDDLDAESETQASLRHDDALQMELAAGYIRMAYIQGGVAGVNLGDTAGSMKSYRTVLRILDAQWQRRKDDPQVNALRFPAAYNLSMMINDPKEAIEFARRYSIEADAWQQREPRTGALQTSYLLHMALGRMQRLAGEYESSLKDLDAALVMQQRLLPLAGRDNASRPMFALNVEYTQALLDGGLIGFQRTETLLAANRNEEALETVIAADESFAAARAASARIGPSDRRMAARVRTLKAFVLAKLGRFDDALPNALEGLRLAEENANDGVGTGRRDLAEAHWRAGVVLFGARDHAHGLEQLKAAVETVAPLAEPDDVLLLDKVLQLQMLNDYADALAAANKRDEAFLIRQHARDAAQFAIVQTANWPAIRREAERAVVR